MPSSTAIHDPNLLWHALTGLSSAAPPTPRHSLAHKRVLLTGAGGSIGSALAHAIAASHPAHLLLLDTSEHSLYEIDRALATVSHAAILGSVTDRPLLDDLFHHHRPEIIFHAAAFKHVPLIEQNPFAALANNALGTWTLAQAAAQHRAAHLLLVSTDKAVDPHSLMGATKRLAELALLALAETTPTRTTRTRMSIVRLGNVLGSHGSVLPLFLDQLARNLPLTVTHPDARRFFLTLDHTVAALLDALETPAIPSTILVPELAPPIRILDLARHLIAHQRATPAEIRFTGLRPGDKLEESLISPREHWLPVSNNGPHPTLCAPLPSPLRALVSPHPTAAVFAAAMHALAEAVAHRDLTRALDLVLQLVPEYMPSPTLTHSIHPTIRQAEEARA
ncbi:MAG TPA: polysaccharide biosynthesis protein [Granulicella sp.]|nr:polysaccharide biosynthesis protein [Granulicella sp.]